MLIHYPAEVVSVIVSFLVSYCDFRQLFWIGRAGRSILTRVQILDIDGKYTNLGAKGYPFYYNHFSSLQRLTISLRFCSFRIYQNFVQFTGVKYLTILLPGANTAQFDKLMGWLECYLNVELRHVSIRVSQKNIMLALQSRGHRARGIHMIDKEVLAEHVLMLSTHNTLTSFDLSIARDHFSVLWSDVDTIRLKVWNERTGLSYRTVQRWRSIGVQ